MATSPCDMLIHVDGDISANCCQDKKRILIDINYTLWQKYFRQGFRKII